ncbi:MAG TPA: NTP transferase domain-containing protein [Sphingomonas sp.]
MADPVDRVAPPFTAIILAAQRAGRVDPLAAAHGVSHKCLVPIVGRPLIGYVARALQATPGLAALRVVIEPEVVETVRRLLPPGPAPVEFVAAADNLADSVRAGAAGLDLAMLITTADNVLLTPPAARAMVEAMAAGADVTLAMASKASVMAAHPQGQRRYYRFSDDEYSNCNLYGLAGAKALAAAEIFRSGGQFAKKKSRLIMAIGPINLLLFRFGRLSLAGAMRRMGRRFRLRIVPVIIADGSHAIDVDNERTYDAAATLLAARPG